MPYDFPKRLRTLRAHRGLSQKQLAALCRLSQSAISNYENGTRKLSREIFTLAKVLEVSPLWLAEGSGPKDPPPNLYQAEPNKPYIRKWPFVRIKPEDLQSLSKEDTAILEETLLALLSALKNNKKSK